MVPPFVYPAAVTPETWERLAV